MKGEEVKGAGEGEDGDPETERDEEVALGFSPIQVLPCCACSSRSNRFYDYS